MTDRLRVGVAGTSHYTDVTHLARIASHPRAQLAAICGRNRGRAEELAAKHDIPQVFTDYREMIGQANLDALVISVPDDLHYPVTMDALDAGLHVLGEKPMALNATEARAMYEKAEAAGVKHMICFTNRWLPHSRYLKQLIDEGYLGRPIQCSLRFLAGYGLSDRYIWRFDRAQGTGVLGDVGSHMIDLARWYIGEISRVSARLGVYADHVGPAGEPIEPANDAAMLAVEFASGAQGSIQLNAVALTGDRGAAQHLAFHGQAGTLELDWDAAAGTRLRGLRRGAARFEDLAIPDVFWEGVNRDQPVSAQVAETFLRQSIANRQFIDAILEDRPVAPSFWDGLKAQEVIDAAVESHEHGRWIRL